MVRVKEKQGRDERELRSSQRRMSADHGIDLVSNDEVLKAPPLNPVVDFFTAVLSDATFKELGGSFLDAVASSGDDVENDIEVWFETRFPSAQKHVGKRQKKKGKGSTEEVGFASPASVNLKRFLQLLATRIRPIVKMARWGVGLRLGFMSCEYKNAL